MPQLRSSYLTVKISPLGAEVNSVKSNEGLEFMWQADKSVWPRHAPVLFPIVGRLKNNQFTFESETFSLSQHGFARDMELELISSGQNTCTFQLQSSTQTKNKFPFDFNFEITYTLNGQTLETEYTIKNTGQKPMFFSVGAHPGFNCPLEAGENFEDYYLEFENSELLVTQLSDGLRLPEKKLLKLDENKLPLNAQLFSNDALVFEDRQVQKISLCSNVSPRKISIECKDWPYFGIWTKADKENSPRFICLEPWHGIADKINSGGELPNKEGIIALNSGELFSSSFLTTFE